MVHSRKKNTRKTLIITSLITALIIIFILIGVLFIQKNKSIPQKSIGIQINNNNNNNYYLEVAKTNQQKKVGLSNRNEICSNCGMLFVFNKEGQYPFWMKDTHIPLDIIWINSQNEIVKIITALDTDSETVYTNADPAKYVIELPANEVFKQDLKVGDTIQIPEIL